MDATWTRVTAPPPQVPRPLPMGVYRHFKGGLYLVQGLAHDANAETLIDNDNFYAGPLGERTVVVYVPLHLNPSHLGPRMAVRTLEDFCGLAEVEPYRLYCENPSACGGGNDACSGHRSTQVRRFVYLGPELTADMLPGKDDGHDARA